MRRFPSIPRPLLFALAMLFAASITAYTVTWVYYVHSEPEAEPLGLYLREVPKQSAAAAAFVTDDGVAEKAGLKVGDILYAVNGRPLGSLAPYYDAVVRGQPGNAVTFEVQSEGGPRRTVEIVLAPARRSEQPAGLTEHFARELAEAYPLIFLLVGLVVLFQRLRDGNAWLLALLFACFIAGPEYQDIIPELPAEIRNPVFAYALALAYIGPAIFYCFFATFPRASPIERRAPWLKWAILGTGLAFTLPCVHSALWYGSNLPFYVRNGWLSTTAFPPIRQWSLLVPVALGFLALIANVVGAENAYARRRIRVMLWGTLAGFGPMMTVYFLASVTGHPAFNNPALGIACNVLLMLVPFAFGYAVVVHRVLEMPVLLKRSARYVLVRGLFTVAMTLLTVFVPFRIADMALQTLSVPPGAAVPFATVLGVAFGMLWVVGAGAAEKKITPRIDRAFFRSVYDARQILEDLAESARRVSSREQLASLMRQQIRQALHPKSMAVYFESGDGSLHRQGTAEKWPDSLSTDSLLLKELAHHGLPWEVPAPDEPMPPSLPQLANLRTFLDQAPGLKDREVSDVVAALAPLEPECLVPLVGRDARLAGLVVLGQRLSEEPYSDEDERLLAAVADQAATALENIRLAETMALKIEAEQKAANEIAIAREVQSKLFPQTHPPLKTLEYAGLCDQARKVGGDYYDFLDLGPGRASLVLADISGKGIFAALLMANLQANLRSQYARALDDLHGLMCSVNRLFCQSTSAGLYATMFFSDYCDQTHRLRYVNCGHNPPLLVRCDGTHQRLESTATVIGLMEEWDCEIGETELRPGDLLVIYSDGVTEAQSDAGVFFGEERLLQAARACAHLPVAEAARAIAQTVHTFSETDQEDDLTLLVARAR